MADRAKGARPVDRSIAVQDHGDVSGRRALFVCGALALVLYVGAFVGLSFGGQSREKPIVAIALGLLVIAALLLQLTLRRVRADGRGGRWIRLGVPLLIMAAGTY